MRLGIMAGMVRLFYTTGSASSRVKRVVGGSNVWCRRTYVMTPKRDIRIDGFLRDQMYTNAKASGEDRNGIVSKGDTT